MTVYENMMKSKEEMAEGILAVLLYTQDEHNLGNIDIDAAKENIIGWLDAELEV